MSCLTYHGNELFIEEVPLKAVAKAFQTPTYVYSRRAITEQWHKFDQSFGNQRHRVCYAVKANSNLSILHLLAKLGAGFDIVSLGEMERVLTAQGKPEQIVFSGVGKTTGEIEHALRCGIYCFNVESIPELERLQSIAIRLNKTIPIALRINPNINAFTHAYISTGMRENKFGIDMESAMALSERLSSMQGLQLIGLACHIGSQITDLEPFLSALDHLIDLYHRFTQQGFSIQHLNLGGGLGVTYQQETPPSIQDYAQAIQTKVAGLPIELILEPGRAMIAHAGVLLTEVHYLKHLTYKNFAIVDAAMNDLLRPALYGAWQDILPVELRPGEKKHYDIAGPVCESADFLGKHRELVLQEKDLLAVDGAGAYGFSMSSNYNSRPRAAEVLIDGSEMHLIRRRETIKDLFAAEIVISNNK